MLLENNFISDKPKFFGRRKGRVIRKAKSTLLETFLPEIKITDQTKLDKNTLFGVPVEEICLEIGFGSGDHLAGQALNNPRRGYIGAEVFQNGVANLLTLITGIKEGTNLPEKITLLPGRVDNIRVYDDDIRLLFARLPNAFLDRIYLLFPDPWPKKRHASRRFVNPENLKELARILKPGGILRIATDHKIYKAWTLRQMHDCPDLNGPLPAAATGNANRPTGYKPNTSVKPCGKGAALFFSIIKESNRHVCHRYQK